MNAIPYAVNLLSQILKYGPLFNSALTAQPVPQHKLILPQSLDSPKDEVAIDTRRNDKVVL